MCGIAGIVGPIGENQLTAGGKMLDALLHRGPDQSGTWQEPRCFMGHRRLSIIDLSEAGRQPMIDPKSGSVIVFNGECYNYVELREKLKRQGWVFQTDSDTEVVLAAISCWGAAALPEIRGMFALAVWNPSERTLLLARDRLGIKPLYFTQKDGRLIFTSELRSLLKADVVEAVLSRDALDAYLWHGFVPGPATIVEGVQLLEPGTVVTVNDRGEIIESSRYWELPVNYGDATTSAEEVVAELERALDLHLVSDVPLGVFLSGGVDSSVIAAMAQRRSSSAIATFNIRFEEARYDESSFARMVAEHLGTDHHEITLTESVFESQLDDALNSLDQPTFDAINSYFVSRAVREAGITVALAGTGGDELFGGYSSFVDLPRARPIAEIFGWLPAGMVALLGGAISRLTVGSSPGLPPQTRWGKLQDLLSTRGDLLGMYQVSYAQFTQSLISQLRATSIPINRWGLCEQKRRDWTKLLESRSVLQSISALETVSFLGERLLRDTDCASMAVSLEARVPFLDHVLVEKVNLLPDDIRFNPIRKKKFLRDIVEDQLPAGVFDRPKSGFELPLDIWCRKNLAPELKRAFECVGNAERLGLRPETLRQIWRAFEAGNSGLYWSRVWGLYVLINWCRTNRVSVS